MTEKDILIESEIVTSEKRVIENLDDEHLTKKAKTSGTFDFSELIKQIEYYLSDENLAKDAFFHKEISSNAERYLAVKHFLNCKKIKAMGINSERDVTTALAGHQFIEVKIDEDGKSWVRIDKELPKLFLDRKRNARQMASKNGKDVHFGGCIVKISAIPENVAWVRIKECLKEAMSSSGGSIRYVSPSSQNGVCYVLSKPFAHDKSFFTELKLSIEGADLSITLLSNEEAVDVIHNQFPKHVQKEREKEICKQRQLLCSKPIFIAEQNFGSIEHLKKCVKDLLDKTEIETKFETSSPAYKVLSALLDYHPRSAEKKKNMIALKVGTHKSFSGSSEPLSTSSKCFYVVKANGDDIECEDFSVMKCINEMARNPPVAAKNTEKSELNIQDEQKENSVAASA